MLRLGARSTWTCSKTEEENLDSYNISVSHAGEERPEAAVQAHHEEMYAGQHWQHWPSLPGEGDDLSRYLRPGDRLAEAQAQAAKDAEAAGEAQAAKEAEPEEAAAEASTGGGALALIAGYGSSGSDNEAEGEPV